MSGSCAHSLRSVFDRAEDVVVAGAAADVAFEFVANALPIELWLAVDHVDGGHDHPRRAKAALESVVVAEGLLDGMELSILGKCLAGQDVCALGLHREH